MEYEIFEQFWSNVWFLASKIVSYYGMTPEEVRQEAAIVYYENPQIEDMFISGNTRGAFNLLSGAIQKSAVDFSTTGIQVSKKDRYDKAKEKIERMLNVYEEDDSCFENEVMRKIEIDRLRSVFSPEEIDDLIEYYEIGSVKYAEKHGMGLGAVRTKIYRKIQKIRNEYL